MLYTYFAAQGDRDAAKAAARVDDELDGLMVKGADPTDELTRLEAVLTGRSLDEIRSDPRHGSVVAESDEGDCVVLSLTDPLTRVLASAEPDVLRRAVSNASSAGGSLSIVADRLALTEFTAELAVLARRGLLDGHKLYCRIAP
ncbi:hypothetical protein VA596_47340 [Amycolatopsis sp., V23-08]|uniref:Uncharacterized protein n=1 Tax=Amycolatopsis heterodermiae TaxID=3110235 RepID=A0ABU5RNE1_9PSEU|nr:hypothetical protein [Amycolatopsis sp., V23-08]MEA5367214.1 hypothetical protein [Amycolatopsis sp., V23-08]